MITLEGFFLTAFIPTVIMILLGLVCLWWRRCPDRNDTLFFVAVVFLFMFFWRISIVVDRRYVLPIIVPGVLLAVLFLKNLSGRTALAGRWLCGILLLGTGIAGTGKAMRFQEPKPYLTDVPAMIHQEIRQHQWNSALVLKFGNLGGHFEFYDTITQEHVGGDLKFTNPKYRESFFTSINYLEPECLLLRYPVLYILISSTEPGNEFSREWQARYGRTPELCYEFIRPKNRIRYQLFRLISPYRSAYLTSTQRLERYRQFNLLPNPDFAQYQELLNDSSELQELTDHGVKLGKISGRTYVPADWQFDMNTWQKAAMPAGVEYTEQQKLRIFSKGASAFIHTPQPFPGGEHYQLGGWLTARKLSIFYVQAIRMRNGKMLSRSKVFEIIVQSGRHEFAGLVDLSDWTGEGVIRFGLAYGDIELENIYLVKQSVFNEQPIR